MQGNIVVCDFCSHESDEDNPVRSAIVRLLAPAQTEEHPSFFGFIGPQRPRTVQLDICDDCAGPLMSMMRERAARLQRNTRKRKLKLKAEKSMSDLIAQEMKRALRGKKVTLEPKKEDNE